jgi:hypothetical protein
MLTHHARPDRTILLNTRNPAAIGALILLLNWKLWSWRVCSI